MFERVKWLMAAVVMLVICGGLVLGPPVWQAQDSKLFGLFRVRPAPDGADLPAAGEQIQCQGAPFILPTRGWIGVLYGDSILGTANHSGLDIFGQEGNGVTPVYAAYDGYLTRLPGWTSAVIIRHPEDPLVPGRQIWTYYTHMAGRSGTSYIIPQIPPGTVELPVKQGALLGYQGDYNGQSWRPIDTHLHFSIVLDNGRGNFLNETDIANTIDPSPYLGMRLNTRCGDRPPVCRPDFNCP